MLRLSDFVTCRKKYYNRGVYISALEHCRKVKFRTYLLMTLLSKSFYVVTCNDKRLRVTTVNFNSLNQRKKVIDTIKLVI